MKLVHFTYGNNIESIRNNGIQLGGGYNPYQTVIRLNSDPEVSLKQAVSEKLPPDDQLFPKCIFSYPIMHDDLARYNCWSGYGNSKRVKKPGRNTAVIFTLNDDDDVWVGAWGWPWEGHALVNDEYLSSGMVYKKKMKLGEFCDTIANIPSLLSEWTNGRYSSIYDILWDEVEEHMDDYFDQKWIPWWMCSGFEVCVTRPVKSDEILDIVDLEKIKRSRKSWYRNGL